MSDGPDDGPDATDPTAPSADDPALEAEVERLRAERDTLRNKLDRSDDVARRGGRLRRTTVVVLIVLATVALAAGGPAVWASRNAFDTEEYLEIVTPLGSDPAVAHELAERITGELFLVLNIEPVLADALPERARFLAGPLTGAVRGFVQDEVEKLLASEAFQQLWVSANRFAHDQLVAVLRGENNEVVSTNDGRVVLNLLPVINASLQRIQTSASNLVGTDITLPQLDQAALPDEMRTTIESALGVDVPEDFGEIVIFDDDSLQAAQDAIVTAERLLWLVLIVFVVAVAGALALSRRRRRTLVQLASALLAVIVIERRLAIIAEERIVDRIADPGARAAVRVTAQTLLEDFLDATTLIGWLLLVVLLVALVTGPYPWAVWVRARIAQAGRFAGEALTGARERAGDEATRVWIREHLSVLQFAGVAVGLLLLVVLPLGWLGLLVLVALVGGYEIVLSRIGREDPSSA
ncbi:MAG: hypothetical protein WEA54_00980 [Actinomycetota bacterium]